MVDSNFLSFGDRGRGRRCEHEVARRLVRLEQRGLRSSGRGGREPDLQGLENTWEGWSDQMGKVKVYPYEGLKGLCGEGIMIRSGSDLEFMSITPTGVREKLQELQGKELGGYWVVQAKDDRLGGHRDAENLMDPERVWRFKKKKKSQIWEVTKHWGKRGTRNDKSSGLTRQRRAVTPRNMGTGWGLGGLDLMSLRLQVGKWIYWVGQGDVMYKQP